MKDFVTFDIAKKLKEKGFRIPCIAHYCHLDGNVLKFNITVGYIRGSNIKRLNGESNIYTDAPTISQVLKWLREEKEIYIIIEPYPTMSTKNKICWSWHFKWNSDGVYMDNIFSDDKSYTTFEEAALAAIKYTSDNLI